MIRYDPIHLAITQELMLRDSWMKELERGLMKLNQALLEYGIQPAQYAHVLYSREKQLVHVYPKHYRSQPYYVNALPTAIKGAFMAQYYPSDLSTQLDEFLYKEFGVE
jgi:hypothetical protein